MTVNVAQQKCSKNKYYEYILTFRYYIDYKINKIHFLKFLVAGNIQLIAHVIYVNKLDENY